MNIDEMPPGAKCELCGKLPIVRWIVNGSHHLVCVECLPAGREMDLLITDKVMQYPLVKWDKWHDHNFEDANAKYGKTPFVMDFGSDDGFHAYNVHKTNPGMPWSPSTDIAAAWEVVEAIKKLGYSWWFTSTSDGFNDAHVRRTPNTHTFSDGRGESMSLSLCRAALKAVL